MAKKEQGMFPYSPSWVDRLTVWVARRPGPAWLTYLAMALFLCAVYMPVKWWDGGLPVGTVTWWPVLVAVTNTYYIAYIHYLDDFARNAMERFHPTTSAPAQRVAELEYRLTTMPRQAVWIMTLVGTGAGILTVAGLAWGIISYPRPTVFASLPATLFEVTFCLSTPIFFLISVYHTVHQLRTVSMIYAELTKVDLFQQRPLYAFARLAAYTSIGWIIPQYFWLTAGLEATALYVALGFLAIAILLGAITFIWPLLGIHRMLVAAKEQLQGAASERLQKCLHAFDEAIQNNDLAEMDLINKAIDNSERERQIVNAIPTWPWQPGLLRGTVTAFLLPLILWTVTRILERLLGP